MKSEAMAVKLGGARGPRAAAPKVSVVSMDAVPDPGIEPGKYAEMFDQVLALQNGNALRVDFASKSHALYVRAVLRKMAKGRKRFLSSSKSPDGTTRYFWFEKT